MVISTNLGYLGSEIGFYFLKKQNTVAKWYSPNFLNKICIPIHCSWSDFDDCFRNSVHLLESSRNIKCRSLSVH